MLQILQRNTLEYLRTSWKTLEYLQISLSNIFFMVLLFLKHILVALNLDQLLCNTCIMYLKKTFQDCLLRPKFAWMQVKKMHHLCSGSKTVLEPKIVAISSSATVFRRKFLVLQFYFLWQMMESYKVWDVLLPEISGARGLFLLLFSGRKPYFAQQEYLPKNLVKQKPFAL